MKCKEIKDVILYVTSTCPYCRVVEEWLKQNNIKVEIVNLNEEEDALYYLEAMGIQSVPALEISNFIIGSEQIINFIKKKIEELIVNKESK